MSRVVVIVGLLILSTTASFVQGEKLQSDNEEGNLFLPTYSRAVQLAFARVSDLESYDTEELSEVESWLIVTSLSIDEHRTSFGKPDFSVDTGILAGTFIWSYENSGEAIKKLEKSLLNSEIETFSPIIERDHSTRFTPNDPDFVRQWHLENTGQSNGVIGEDANVTGTWDKYNGSGVTISVIDDGLEHTHPDIQPHYSASLSYDWCNDDPDPTPQSWNGHGTSVAGVAAAVGNNSLDVTGAAFGATIAGSTLIACGTSDGLEADALSYKKDEIDIYTNSWGPFDDGSRLEAPGPLTIAAMESSVYSGRSGLGNIYTWAAGNGLANNDNSNYDGYANSRYTIAVTAINHDGSQSWYAEPGANVLVAAHSDGDGEGITTTDITGSGGSNSGNVTEDFGGTSSATPLAAGVIALMLEANPNLSWRDVQNILVHSSRIVDASDSSWETNGAGLQVSHKYGFGSVDAGAATSLAENWTSSGHESNASFGPFTPGQVLSDGASGWDEFNVSVPVDLQIESIDLIVDIDHPNRGELEIILQSPDGHVSWLAEDHSDSSNDYSNWMFNTVQHWGESSAGNWTLRIRDSYSGNTGTLNMWEIIFHGVGNISDFDEDGWPDYNDDDDDNDGWGDETENDCGTDQFNASSYPSDFDQDSVCDYLDMDDDDDGWSDETENDCGTDQFNASSYPTDSDLDGDCDFVDIDDDNDGLSDENETLLYKTDPLDPDTDGDGLGDFEEISTYGTNALDPDTDGDGILDGVEIDSFQTDPLTFNNDNDTDGWYDFQDCDDDDDESAPDLSEELDGKDNDCDGMVDEGFNGSDSDQDGIFDWAEYHVHGTNFTDSDTDNDGLDDGTEILVKLSDPLVFDDDLDADGFYWFEDCDDNESLMHPTLSELLDSLDNDCDSLIDEDFWSIDSDLDGLTDYDEFHNHSTDPNDGDSDDDGLTDGTEISLDSDPNQIDLDSDSDGIFAFMDCNDEDPEVGDVPEKLDGKDNDCDDLVDEDFYFSDADGDQILDYEEFHNYSTNPFSNDSDMDGLNDGTEILIKFSDPLGYDYDRDLDGFYEFEDCDDLVSTTFPGASELWNGVDDDCDQVIDDGIDRASSVTLLPGNAEVVFWDSANESLILTIGGVSESLEAQIIWTFEEFSIEDNATSGGRRVTLDPIDCSDPATYLEDQLCSEGSGRQYVTAEIVESGSSTMLVWEIWVNIWIEEEESSTSIIGSIGFFGVSLLIVGLFGIGIIAGFRISYNSRLQDALDAYGIIPERLAIAPNSSGADLPSAPDLQDNLENISKEMN